MLENCVDKEPCVAWFSVSSYVLSVFCYFVFLLLLLFILEIKNEKHAEIDKLKS